MLSLSSPACRSAPSAQGCLLWHVSNPEDVLLASCPVKMVFRPQALCTDHISARYSGWFHLFLPVALVPGLSVLGWRVPASLPSYGSSVQGLPQVMLRKALQADVSASTCRQDLCLRVETLVGHLISESRCQAQMAQHFLWPSIMF